MRNFILFLFSITLISTSNLYSQNNKKLAKRSVSETGLDKTMEWYRDAKFGMFIHWGLYSVAGKAEWFRYNQNIPDDEYRSIANQFNPTEFDAESWVLAAKSSGMKWITIVAKHHDGFAIYNSEADGFDITATPFGKKGRDPLEELAAACRKHDMKLGFYYSHYQDWNHPGGGKARISYAEKSERPFRKYMDEKALPQVKELLTKYGDIVIIWFDTPMHLSDSEADEFRELVRQTSPGTLIGGRLDDATGDFWSIPDDRVPVEPFGEPWETCMTSNHAWGWRIPQNETRPAREMIEHLCSIVSRGGNFLLNTGPSPTGKLNKNDLAEFRKVGEWLKINGEAIYGTRANPYYNSPYLCTTKENKIYFHLFNWPEGSFIIERLNSAVKKVWMLADPTQKQLEFSKEGNKIRISLPENKPDSINSIIVVETDDVADIQNFLPAEDKNGTINIPARKITIIEKRFSSLNEDQSVLSINDTRRAWVNGSFEVNFPGKYDIYINNSKGDSCNNISYWIKINGKKIDVPIIASGSAEEFTNQMVGNVEFKNAGVYNYTIRPTDWYLETDNILTKIKNIQLVKTKD